MEQFIVSARKHRPTHFNEVVGQRNITTTLENAIANNHLAQALLFTGPRGVGKTTCARILAKKINETSSDQTDEDFAFNIFELDAASNNSVDDIRELIDQVRIPPQVGKYKVYIIDEVHMLSTAAFNAFLKTLEEPPKHAIFILATTEKHKIIPTILSRCQIFDFKRIGVIDIKNHLQTIAEKEGIVADEDALHIIAQKADGALRDALSSFDRVVGFAGKHLTREAVAENLNVLDYSYYFEVTHLVLLNDIPKVFLAYDAILNKGYDGHQFIRGLASHFRDLLVAQNQSTISLLEVGDKVKEMYLEQSKMASMTFLKKAIAITNACDLSFKNSQNQRLLVELCLLELASLTSIEEKKNLIERVSLPPEAVVRSSETPVLSQTKQSQDINTRENTITSSPPSQENRIETLEQEDVIDDSPSDKNTLLKDPPPSVVNEDPIHNLKKDSPTHDVQSTPEVLNDIIQTHTVAVGKTLAPQEASPKRRKKSALSLSSVMERQEMERIAEANKPVTLEMPKEAFTKEDFEKTWTDYCKTVSERREHNLHSHLNMAIPQLKGTVAYVEYPNNTIKIEVERDRANFLSYIRNALQNYDFDLHIKVNEVVTKKYVYTEREIYDKMVEINPQLNTFRQTLDLEF